MLVAAYLFFCLTCCWSFAVVRLLFDDRSYLFAVCCLMLFDGLFVWYLLGKMCLHIGFYALFAIRC